MLTFLNTYLNSLKTAGLYKLVTSRKKGINIRGECEPTLPKNTLKFDMLSFSEITENFLTSQKRLPPPPPASKC